MVAEVAKVSTIEETSSPLETDWQETVLVVPATPTKCKPQLWFDESH